LGQAQPLGGGRDLALPVDFLEDGQQVEVDGVRFDHGEDGPALAARRLALSAARLRRNSNIDMVNSLHFSIHLVKHREFF
jgi:hypothetical protein